MKSLEDHFTDWESSVFGYGYGTGEEHTLKALKDFLAAVPDVGNYDYQKLESAVSPPVAWLLINALVKNDKLEYGTSPRYGWLTDSGRALREFVCGHSLEEMYALTARDEDYCECFVDHCNCGDVDCRPGNPFWPKQLVEFHLRRGEKHEV